MPSVIETLPTKLATNEYQGSANILQPAFAKPILYQDILSEIDIPAWNIAVSNSLGKAKGEGTFSHISAVANLQPYEAYVTLKSRQGGQLDAVEKRIFQEISTLRTSGGTQYSGTSSNVGTFNWFTTYYEEHPVGSRYKGDFNIAEGFRRAFTFTDSSYQPANIIRSFTAGTVAVFTGGLSVTQPEINGTTLVSSDTNRAGLLDSAYVGANSFGTVRAGDPNVPETFLNKLARIGGGAVSSIATGKAFSGALSTPTKTLPAGVQGPTQPLSFGARVGNIFAGSVSTTSQGYGYGQLAQGVIGVFGQKGGGAILALFSGDVARAIEIITTNPTSNPGPIFLYGPSGGGGGGGGVLPSQNTGQSLGKNVMIPIIGVGTLVFLLWYFLRKKA